MDQDAEFEQRMCTLNREYWVHNQSTIMEENNGVEGTELGLHNLNQGSKCR